MIFGNNPFKMKHLIVVMGISGSGKSTVGNQLAKSLSIPFLDADDFHPKANVMKMSSGQALTDEDRWPWLAAIVEHVLNSHRGEFVLACSALKQSYRDYLSQRLKTDFVFLEITEQEAFNRLSKRSSHFMPSSLVKSQMETLEVPEEAITVNATTEIQEIINFVSSHFQGKK